MIKNKFKKAWIIITKMFPCRQFVWLYEKSIHFLLKSKWMAKFLAHGGIHMILLIVLGIIAYFMGSYLAKSNVASFNQLVYTFYGDTLNNYRLNYISFEKDMSRRPDNTYNMNDIRLSYGYIPISNSVNKKVIQPFKHSKINYCCDLVSVVKRVKCDNKEDTLINLKYRYEYYSQTKQYRIMENVSNHEKKYYALSTFNDSTHIFSHVTHAQDKLIEWGKLNPVFSFWIGIVTNDNTSLNDKSIIKINFNNINKSNSVGGIIQPLIVEKVIPQPSSMTINEIVYKGKELDDVLKQKGIYVSGYDPIKKDEVEQKNLKYTVYLGTIIAFMLDIIVQLVLKWRKLKEDKKEEI